MRARVAGGEAFKLCAALLRYPDERLAAAGPELAAAVAALPRGAARAALAEFLRHLDGKATLELEQAFVETFDVSRRTSLYLTYYVHGDTRKRGVALLRLKRLYAAAGLELVTGELPDYLPLVLEFAALAPAEGETLLQEHRPSLELLRGALREAGSPYALVLDAVCALLPRLGALERRRVLELAAAGPPEERVGLEPFAPPETMPGARV
ncbi:MAG TPA: nitrate reductase molybdenum cofactor assembly chaperone [Gaiellaceae bacterium]|nr:nitrate reductase molybdenum cofactor assembly chaperone [Gaiellaceae bacterium]